MTRYRRWAGWATVSLLVAFGALVLTAPASLPARLIENLTANRLRVVASTGSAWQGGATLVASGWSAGQSERLAVTWQLDLGRWHRAELAWLLATPGQSLRLVLSPWHWELDTSGFSVPVAALRPFFPGGVANYGWSGEVRLISRKLGRTWFAQRWDGSAQIELQALGVRELAVDPLGSFRLELKPEDDSLAFTLATLAGPVHLDGSAKWQGPRLSCAGTARLAQGEAVDVGRLLDHLARRVSPGNWRFACPA